MKQNYSKFSNKFKNKENYEGIREPINLPVEEPKEEIIREPIETGIEEPTATNYIKSAVVIGCEKLNLREEPSKDAKVLCVLKKGEKVEVDLKIEGEPKVGDASFYQVCTVAGVKGYCMTKYISIE